MCISYCKHGYSIGPELKVLDLSQMHKSLIYALSSKMGIRVVWSALFYSLSGKHNSDTCPMHGYNILTSLCI